MKRASARGADPARGVLVPFKWVPTGDAVELRILRADDPREYERRLKDDALCRWNGLMLRYEQLDRRCWWWCVYGRKPAMDEVAGSNEEGAVGANERSARLLAEGAAIRYLIESANRRQPRPPESGGRRG